MRRLERTLGTLSLVAMIAALLPTPSSAAVRPAVADLTINGDTAAWTPQAVGYDRLVLTVGGPDGYSSRQEFALGASPTFKLFDQAGFPLADGLYKYDLVAVPRVDAETRQRMAAAHEAGDDSIARQLQREGKLPAQESRQSGTFSIRDGAFVPADLKETPAAPGASAAADALVQGAPPPGGGDLGVLLTGSDGTIRNSLCVGFDCLTSPTYSDTTILTMENNNRIKFDDTSVGGFPANDWEIEANSSLSGGANYLGFNDCASSSQGGCATDLVFAVEAGVRQSALYVESDGDVGIGTSNPVLDLHIQTTNTPGIRLEQTAAGGFSAQSWDIAGNESSFFIRDATNGSHLPFRIRPGAPSSSIDIAANGNVGIGTASPGTKLVLRGQDGGSGNIQTIRFENSGTSVNWFFQNDQDNTFKISRESTGGSELTVRRRTDLDGATLLVDGSVQATNVTFPSSRALKTDFTPLDASEILARLVQVPISEWRFKEGAAVRHIGPVAEDFQQAFGEVADGKHISMMDANGITMAAVQGLYQMVKAKDQVIDELQGKIAALESAVTLLQQSK